MQHFSDSGGDSFGRYFLYAERTRVDALPFAIVTCHAFIHPAEAMGFPPWPKFPEVAPAHDAHAWNSESTDDMNVTGFHANDRSRTGEQRNVLPQCELIGGIHVGYGSRK